MKLITKNFTGQTPTGQRYKITMKKEPCEVKKYTAIHISLYTEIDVVTKKTWVLQDNVCNVYENESEYTDTLKKTLIEAETTFGIQLIKSDLKIAI
ncbi:MAG: hypothetical protein Tsb0033_27480 [Winogradskyella sp.]